MSKRRAVVIGINKYKEEDIPELKGPSYDAKELAQLLEEEGDFVIEHLLLNEQASFLAIRQALSDLLWKTNTTDISLFYFSGHGFEDGRGIGYLAPYDMRQAEPFVYGISMYELRQMVIEAKGKSRVVGLLDCCYSGLAAQGEKAAAASPRGIGHQFDGLPQGQGCTILASSGKDQKSREKAALCERAGGAVHEHGIFTFHLLEGLQGKAASAEGHVSLEKLCGYVATAMTGDDHMPSLFQSNVSGETIITIVGRREKIDRLHCEANDYIERGNVYALFAAIERLGGIRALAPELASARDLQNRIDDILSKYRSDIGVWIRDNLFDIGPNYADQMSFLRSFEKTLCVEEVIKLNRTARKILLNLCRVSDAANPDSYAYGDLTKSLDELRSAPSVAAKNTLIASPITKGASA